MPSNWHSAVEMAELCLVFISLGAKELIVSELVTSDNNLPPNK